uniref:Gypsy retrotransposon integrase-like protein 1 n=1 Tax=Leptobrachium leishanense TaxID=445787 RepID=A0A8C5QLZ1_9ANUR
MISVTELLAIVSALSEWRHLLEGTLDPLLIITDHKNLTYIGDVKHLNSRQARWSLLLSRFNFVLTYRPGDRNVKTDALSCQYDPYESNTQDHNPIVSPEHIVASAVLSISSPFLERLQVAQMGAPPNKPPDMLFVPEKERQDLLIMFHDSKPAGHPGITKTLTSISRQFWWPTMRQDVRLFVFACQVCARSITSKTLPVGLLQPSPIPNRPWSHLSMDFIVDLPKSKGHTVVLTVVDRFSKMAHFVPLPKLPTAKELAVVFARESVQIHGVPSEIVSDRGAQFVSRFWRDFCAEMRVRSAFSSAYHPQSNGAAERANQGLEQYIRCFTTQQQDNWLELLPWAEYARNNAVNETTGHSSFFCHLCFFSLRLYRFSLLNRPSRLSMNISHLQEIWRQIRENMERNVAVQKRKADRHRLQAPSYNVGDRVWLSTRNVKLRVPSMKMAPRFIGPYKIICHVNPVAYALALPKHLRLHNVFHTSLLKPLLCNRYTRVVPPPPPVQVD